ncbi:MAG: AAA family ATPase [Rhodoferax sp.]|nr:AAA family ATPase [Rhodoferax sp.]
MIAEDSVDYTLLMSSLYLDHFGLVKSPFQITPDPDFFFAGGRRGDVLAALLHVAAHDEGIVTLVAEIGSGKTLLARLMIARLNPQVCAVYLANPCFSRDEIIAAIGRDLGLTDMPGSKEGKLAVLQQELLRRHTLGQRVVLVVDEAHAMPIESLEEVRLLSNLETGQHKLINIMLFGQPELDALLAEPRLRQVHDRVIHRFELQALQSMETSAYIDHRLRAAGWQGAGLFSPAAMAGINRAAQGRARRINLLADKALLAAYAQGSLTVELSHVSHAMHELPLGGMRVKMPTKSQAWTLFGLSFGLALLMAAAAVGWLGWYRNASSNAHLPSQALAPPAATSAAITAATITTLASIVTTTVVTTPPVTAPISAAAKVPEISPKRVTPLQSVPSGPSLSQKQLPISEHMAPIFERTKNRLNQTRLSGYTMQLVALESVEGVEGVDRYLAQIAPQFDAHQIYGQFSQYKGRTYMALYAGDFATALDCARAIEALPLSIRSNRPFVRSWVKVKQEQTP